MYLPCLRLRLSGCVPCRFELVFEVNHLSMPGVAPVTRRPAVRVQFSSRFAGITSNPFSRRHATIQTPHYHTVNHAAQSILRLFRRGLRRLGPGPLQLGHGLRRRRGLREQG